MQAVRFLKDNWITLTLGVWLATLTNHSRGEVVYRKVSTLQALGKEEESTSRTEEAASLETGLRIVKISRSTGDFLALLAGGAKQGLVVGSTLEGRRSQRTRGVGAQAWIPTAELKVVEVREDYSIARVQTDGSQLSAIQFPDYPGVMVGDRVFVPQINLAQTVRVVPSRVLTYDQLFVDPKGFPSSFELTAEGKAYLLEQAQVFVDLHAPMLLIEGHTDHHGDRVTNQIESYQRALTIRQILIEELGLDGERLVAIGLGETEILPEPYLPGRDREARRIVLRAKNHETSP